LAFVLGDGRGKPESDCLIALGGFDAPDVVPFGPNALPSVQCTDCDPACDLDGISVPNGRCDFSLRACVNVADVAACTPAALSRTKAVAKRKGAAAIDLSPVPAGASFTCGNDTTVPVAVKTRKASERPGTAQLVLLATADERPRDRDKLLVVCNPRPAGEACPPATTTTTLPPPTLGTPFGLRASASFAGPPTFVLRWNFDEGTLPVDAFLVHTSGASFADPDDATLIAALPGSARAADVELRRGTGVRHFRVSAVSADGTQTALSSELAIDTTARVVMIADKTTNDVFELFSVVPGSGAEPTALSGPLVQDGDVDRFFFSPDGRRVVFSADKETNNLLELFVVPLDGSAAPTKISGALVTGGAPQPFLVAFSPDGSRIAFTADKIVDERFELFVVPADGSTEPVAVSGTLVDGGDVDVDEFAWSPDGRRLAFIADKLVDGTNELFVADPAGGVEPTKVSGTLVENGQVQGFAWSPDGTRLGWRAGKDTVNFDEIFVARPDGIGEPLKVTGVLPNFAPVNSDPLWSPDSTRIAFSCDLLTNAVFEVFVTPADGSAGPIRVSGASQAFSDIVNFKWSPDGTRLAFNMDKNLDNADEVFVADGAGVTEPIRVSGAFITDREAFNVQWSPRGDRVAYFADINLDGRFELFVAPPDVVDGALEASGPVGAGNEVFQFAWAPDGASLVVAGSLETAGLSEVFVTPAVGGTLPVKVSGTITPGGGVNSTFFGFAPLSN
jgi:Tol biopolymer transport system component